MIKEFLQVHCAGEEIIKELFKGMDWYISLDHNNAMRKFDFSIDYLIKLSMKIQADKKPGEVVFKCNQDSHDIEEGAKVEIRKMIKNDQLIVYKKITLRKFEKGVVYSPYPEKNFAFSGNMILDLLKINKNMVLYMPETPFFGYGIVGEWIFLYTPMFIKEDSRVIEKIEFDSQLSMDDDELW